MRRRNRGMKALHYISERQEYCVRDTDGSHHHIRNYITTNTVCNITTSIFQRTIWCRWEQSLRFAKRSLLRLRLILNHRHFILQWWLNGGNCMTLYFYTNHGSAYNITMTGISRINGKRLLYRCVTHRQTGLSPGLMLLDMCWITLLFLPCKY